MIAATVLAAGQSRRMGVPKSSLQYHDRTFLATILDSITALGLKPIVVLAEHAANLLEENELQGVTVVCNKEPEAGPLGSIRQAIRSILDHPVEALLVWPVDFPHVEIETVRSLVDGYRRARSPIVVPVCGGRRGHPVLFDRTVFEELLQAPAAEGARAVVRADPTRVLEVPVADSAVLDSLNTPRAYLELLRREDTAGG